MTPFSSTGDGPVFPARVAVAESAAGGLAPLGRAVRFLVYEVEDGRPRHPRYRVRHDNPGETCGAHDELLDVLADCDVVIAASAGGYLRDRMRSAGRLVEVTGDGDGRADEVVAGYLQGLGRRGGTGGTSFSPPCHGFPAA